MTKKVKAGELMQETFAIYQQTRSILGKLNLSSEGKFTLVYEALIFVIENFSDKVQFSWHKDPAKQGWGNENAEIVVSYGVNIHIPLPLSILEEKGLIEKVKKIMSKTISVVNDHKFVIEDLSPETEVKIVFQPFRPGHYSNTEHTFDIGNNVTQIAECVYMEQKYNYTRYPDFTANENEYYLVITDPRVVGLNESVFPESEDRANYRLARIVRKATEKVMNSKWKLHIVDQLPEIKSRNVSTPANTSNVSWNGFVVNKSIVVLTKDGWTGDRDDYARDIYVLRSLWEQLEG